MNINIPANVKTIDYNPFLSCALTSIMINSENTNFHVANNCLIDTINKK